MRRLVLAALAGALLALPASATSIRLRSLPDLVAEADRVLQGRVVASRAVQDGRLIFTEYDVAVDDWLKPGPQGSSGTLTFRQPGGTAGGVTMTVVGAAHFAVGDELVLFTRDYGGAGHQQVANLQQGALRVARGEPAPGILPGEARRRLAQAASFPGGAPDDLEAFKARVRELAAGSAR